ncbi:hypothetical protein IKJ53_04070 [bacterium]|nr:hypothetical protein [bacterium]
MVKKINIASYRVLQTLLALFNNNLTMAELVSELNQKGFGTYNSFIVQKYIHTLRACGIDIQKIQNKYCIINFPIGIKFSDEDTKLLYDIKKECEKILLHDIAYSVNKLFEKLHLPCFKSDSGSVFGPNAKKLKYLKHAYSTNTEVILYYPNLTKETSYIREIKFIDGEYNFIAANESGVKTHFLNEIDNIEFLIKPSKFINDNTGYIYRLLGSRAERYQLRPNERMLKYKEDKSIDILTEFEEPELLMRRLLRYDSFCKIIGPVDFLERFKKEINDTLANYNIPPDRKSKNYLTNHVSKNLKKKVKK